MHSIRMRIAPVERLSSNGRQGSVSWSGECLPPGHGGGGGGGGLPNGILRMRAVTRLKDFSTNSK